MGEVIDVCATWEERVTEACENNAEKQTDLDKVNELLRACGGVLVMKQVIPLLIARQRKSPGQNNNSRSIQAGSSAFQKMICGPC